MMMMIIVITTIIIINAGWENQNGWGQVEGKG